eukprot:TRINITY_DN11878_c0_g1_i6.p1 TRINITY_DN11878_c0_g1~~TRINITY_DN11878_c0_g1_i6.p1  ORF type:complete len:114 (+),score=19.33 TRINITY_DN11878_c0_g1_i6:108-449(+)
MTFSVMTDIPKLKKGDNENLKTAFAYCVNVLTMVHCEEFMRTESELFHKIVIGTLDALLKFGGPSVEGSQVASILLGSLCSKLAANKKSFSLGEIGRAVQQECRDRSRMPSSA